MTFPLVLLWCLCGCGAFAAWGQGAVWRDEQLSPGSHHVGRHWAMVALTALGVAGFVASWYWSHSNYMDQVASRLSSSKSFIPTLEEAEQMGRASLGSTKVFDYSVHMSVERVAIWVLVGVAAVALVMWASAKPRRRLTLRGAVAVTGEVTGFEAVSPKQGKGHCVVPAKVRFNWEGKWEDKVVRVYLVAGHPDLGALEMAEQFMADLETRSFVPWRSRQEKMVLKQRRKHFEEVLAEGKVEELPLWFYPATGRTIIRTRADDALMAT